MTYPVKILRIPVVVGSKLANLKKAYSFYAKSLRRHNQGTKFCVLEMSYFLFVGIYLLVKSALVIIGQTTGRNVFLTNPFNVMRNDLQFGVHH